VPRPAPAPAPAPVEQPLPARIPAPVTLAFVGDINLGTLTIPGGVPPEEGRGLLDASRDALKGDLVVGNFEGVLGDSGTTYKCGRKGKHVTLADTAQPKPEPVEPKRPKPGARVDQLVLIRSCSTYDSEAFDDPDDAYDYDYSDEGC